MNFPLRIPLSTLPLLIALCAAPAVGRQTRATPATPKAIPKSTQKATTAEPTSPKHIFFFIPAYKVDYGSKFVPLSPQDKWKEFAEGAYDPLGLAALGVETGLEHSHADGFCGYGSGIGGFGKCYGSSLLDANVSSFFGDFLFPVWLHQDPRYFRLGPRAGVRARIWYAVSRVFIARTDSGGWTFASGATGGTVLAAVVSNLYYPPSERNVQHTFSRMYWDLGGTAIFNLEAEFWPDIEHRLRRWF